MWFTRLVLTVLLLFLVSPLLALTIVGENGSIVYYNGKLIGVIKNGSLTFEATFPGILKVTKPGYVDFEKEVTEDGVVVVELSFPAYLNVSATPAAAKIYLDDILVGTGQAKVSTKPGRHRITVRADGYTEWSGEVQLSPFEEKRVEVNLKKTTTLKLVSDVQIEGALLNGQRVSVPGTYEVVPGTYKLELPVNYVTNRVLLEVPSINEYVYRVDSRRYFKLSVLGKPERAIVKINELVYTTPIEIFLAEGNYEVTISAPGYTGKTYTVKLLRDEYLVYNLEPLGETSTTKVAHNLVVEYDGFERERVVKKLWFTAIKNTDGEMIWFGFTDASIHNVPSTVPVAFARDFQLKIGEHTFKGPGIIQVPPATQVEYLTKDGYRTMSVKTLTVLDAPERCLVNIFSRSVLDVYINGNFVGRTPIYLLELPEGRYEVEFRLANTVFEKKLVTVSRGRLNEIKSEK
ncbi:PEGA domain-containing protein [Fervidobacterium thailandense]|uniref:PEGA domain-containing protein n=1 Tax=Fervidobacterium thailandense TaxID=1008305 RepID=A0A1E3G358_9BACT|nr:PEGA domain-containing protein [Fervidobacterium thailandense]ODN30705.1 hypothetical protein A4H02_04000 [Fervidobacterium thailandense]